MRYTLAFIYSLAIAGTSFAQGFMPKPPHCAILYGNANFQQNEFPDPGVYSLKDNEKHVKLNADPWGKFNDKTSAASVRAGCVLTLYKHDYFRVPLQVIEGPAVVTHQNGSLYHNDEASSAECMCPDVWEGPLIHPPGGPEL